MTLATTNPPIEALARMVDHHGARAILAALLRVFADRARVRRTARLEMNALSDHLRRDLGLGPGHGEIRHHWEVR